MDPNKWGEIIGLVSYIKARTLELMEEARSQACVHDDIIALLSSDTNNSNTVPVSRGPRLQNDITSSPYFMPILDGFENVPLLLNDDRSKFGSETTNSTMSPSEINDESVIFNETPPILWDSTLDTTADDTQSFSNRPVKRKFDFEDDEPPDSISPKRPKIQENSQSHLRLTMSKKRPPSKDFSESEILLKRRKVNLFGSETTLSNIDVEAVTKFKRTLDEIHPGLEPPLKIRSVISEYGTENAVEILNENNSNKGIGDSSSSNWLPVASLEKEDVPVGSIIKFKWNNTETLEGLVLENHWCFMVLVLKLPILPMTEPRQPTYRLKSKMTDVMILSNAQASFERVSNFP